MAEQHNARKIARKMILAAVQKIEYDSIGGAAEEHFEPFGGDAFDELCVEVDDLIRAAVVTVTFPEGEADHA